MSELGDLYHENFRKLRPYFPVLALCGVATMVFVLFAFLVMPRALDPRVLYFPPADPLDAKPVAGKPIPPMDVAAMLAGSPELVAAGKSEYAIQCQSCHGPEGKGNGPAGLALNPRPRNFTVPDGWKTGYKITDIYHTLSEGLGAVMPAFDVLSPEKRFALAHYVQSLGRFNHGPEDATAVAFLNQNYHLSEGGREPNRVSVPFMMAYLAEREQPAGAIPLPPESDGSDEARLLRRAVADPARVARTLERAAGWHVSSASLAEIALAGSPANGFSATVGTFSRTQWEQLRTSLLEHLSRKNQP